MSQHPGVTEVGRLRDELHATALPESLATFCRDCAGQHGEKVAVDYFQQGMKLTYRDLHVQSNRIAANLQALGYRKGAHLAVMLPNGPESVLVWFAIAKIAAVIVPVNTAYRGRELDYLLNQSDAQGLIIGTQYLDAFAEMNAKPDLLDDAHVHAVNGTGGLGALKDGGDLDVFDPGYSVTAHDLMNLQYTSGTTGSPKGCMLTQEYWLLLSQSIAAAHQGYGVERLLYWAPFFYMDGQWSFLTAMALGGTAFIAEKMSLTNFLDWIHDLDAHYCVLPEPILKTVAPSPRDRDLPIRFAHTFGWRPSARAEAEERFGIVARDSFGMTEVGPAMICPRAAGKKLEQSTCGLAAAFRETRVVDEHGVVCEPDSPGELQIRGRGIMLGYYKRPDANAEAFDGDWFRSGDLFVKDADGYHRIVGRLKEMIKRAGENISASEVEAAMREAPAIAEAAAIAVPDERRREEVMVLIRMAEGFTPADMPPEAVADHATRLAVFKRPRYLAYVDDYPRTATNKIAKSKITRRDIVSGIHDLANGTAISAEKIADLLPV